MKAMGCTQAIIKARERKSETANMKVICGFTPLIKVILKTNNYYFQREFSMEKKLINRTGH
jgi:hypothetical protein